MGFGEGYLYTVSLEGGGLVTVNHMTGFFCCKSVVVLAQGSVTRHVS